VKRSFILIPLLGIVLFILLYVISTFLYPDGSDISQTTKGFDWLHNYWCDLTGTVAKNGEKNAARPIALLAMIILCLSLMMFWCQVPALIPNTIHGYIARYSGVLSMLIAVFLFTNFHDLVINAAGAFGIIALGLTYIGLYQSRMYALFSYGLVCLVLILVNYVIYQTSIFKIYLPVVQKITFLLFLLWVAMINIYFFQKSPSIEPNRT